MYKLNKQEQLINDKLAKEENVFFVKFDGENYNLFRSIKFTFGMARDIYALNNYKKIKSSKGMIDAIYGKYPITFKEIFMNNARWVFNYKREYEVWQNDIKVDEMFAHIQRKIDSESSKEWLKEMQEKFIKIEKTQTKGAGKGM